MNTLIEREAIAFFENEMLRGLNGRFRGHVTVSVIKQHLDAKMHSYSRNADKLTFLQSLHSVTKKALEDHQVECTEGPEKCSFSREHQSAIFAIEQELESVSLFCPS